MFDHFPGWILIVVMFTGLLSSGCRAIQPPELSYNRYIPYEMEWVVTKLEANVRVPFNSRGYPYALDVQCGKREGEILIYIVYQLPELTEKRDEMLLSIQKDIYDAKRLLDVEKQHNTTGIRSRLYATVAVFGHGFPELNKLAATYSDQPTTGD